MAEWSRELENRCLLRAGLAPLVVLSFALVGGHFLRHWTLPPSVSLLLGPIVLFLCLFSGVPYLLKIPQPTSSQVALVIAYVPFTLFSMSVYTAIFMIVVFRSFP